VDAVVIGATIFTEYFSEKGVSTDRIKSNDSDLDKKLSWSSVIKNSNILTRLNRDF
jgi:hypothetical protein